MIAMNIRFRDESQVKKIKRAAKKADMSFAKFVRNHSEKAADVVLSDKQSQAALTAPGATVQAESQE